MAEWDFILAPSTVAVDIVLDEVAILANSLKMLGAKDFHSGLHEWIRETASEMSDEQRKLNAALSMYIDHLVLAADKKTFPEFIDAIPTIDEQTILNSGLRNLRQMDGYPGDEVILNDLDAYIEMIKQYAMKKFGKKTDEFDRSEFEQDWELLRNPQELLSKAQTHYQYMWDTYLKSEWARTKPMLSEAVEAFNEIDYDGMSAFSAIETVTGRNMRGKDFFEERLETTDRLIFMPSAYLGPYISWGATEDDRTMLFFFGARAPKNSRVKSAALSRSELLVRLNALADETRLKILELLTESPELCAQDFINELDLSQSSASRHLRQLTASGYLNERRRDVAKCYSLNPDRIDDTIQALKGFLKKA